MNNYANIEMAAIPENVSLARIMATGFIAPLDPTVDESSDIKTAVSEAVTNAIIHGYHGCQAPNAIQMHLACHGRTISVTIADSGVGINDIDAVRQPMYTTKPDLERSGMGFTIMETFMDSVEIKSTPGAGTTIILTKTLGEIIHDQ